MRKHAISVAAELDDDTLLPGREARMGTTRFADWLGAQQPH